MSKNYLLIYGGDITATRDSIGDYLTKSGWISFWYYSMPNSLLLKSNYSAQQISQAFENKYGIVRHFIIEVSLNSHGRMPKEHWDIFKNSLY